MKPLVGILTFQWADNYGGLLQCYALQRYLDERDCDTQVINYWPDHALSNRATSLGLCSVFKQFGIIPKINVRQLTKNILLGRVLSTKVKTENMDRFRNTYVLKHVAGEKVYINRNQLEPDMGKFNVLLCGSDQIWNPNLTGGDFDPCYFLKFDAKHTIKASYAASMGTTFKQEWEQQFGSLIDNLDYISTRESSLADTINNKYGKESIAVMDPVFLLNSTEWNSIIPSDEPSKPYILLYVLQRNSEIVSVANWLSKETELPLHIIGAKNRYVNATYLTGCSIEDFLFQFKHATYILTNSFHGVSFSVIFRKKFLAFLDTQKPTRIMDLLKDLGLFSRIYQGKNKEILFESPDYASAQEKLETKVRLSTKYLDICVSKARKGLQ